MGKEKSTFDTDADFIPFEFSDDESEEEIPIEVNGDGDGGESRKRKRDEESPERGPVKQRVKASEFAVNPWQTSIHDYSFSNEPARM
jgi:hypothetical protein